MIPTPLTDIQLPEDIVADLADFKRAGETLALDKLKEIGRVLAQKRDDAVKERKSSGIEGMWTQAEEAYLGVDNANRGEYEGSKWAKPPTMDGPVRTGETRATKSEEIRSTVFVRLTARYVDAGAAKLSEILLPPDDKAFSFEPTPIPELINAKDDERQLANPQTGQPLERDPKPEEMPAPPGAPPGGPNPSPGQPGIPPEQQPGVPLKVKDLAQEQLDQATEKAKKAETRIDDWLVEAGFRGEARKCIFDAAKLGVAVLKGPFPRVQKSMAAEKVEGGIALKILEAIVPGVKRIDPWNFFPDPSCGENIHDGEFLFERDRMTAKQLASLKKSPGYLKRQIEKVLKEGPEKRNTDGASPFNGPKDNRFTVWYFSGTLTREEMEVINSFRDDLADDEISRFDRTHGQEEIFIQATLVNDTIIRAVMDPLDSGEFVYYTMPWQRREGTWAGVGIPEQCAVPQRIVNAATRAMLDNAGKSAGSLIVVNQSIIQPADGNWAITRDKIFVATLAGTEADISRAFAVFNIPTMQEPLMRIIDYGFKLAEESTNIPLITQGQSGDTTPDTLGATQLQNNNANQLLRNVGYQWDDCITERFIRACYQWLLLDPDVPEEEKGDYRIHAHGSVALVERAIQEQTLMQTLEAFKDPAFKCDPAKAFAEYLKSKKLNPKNFQLTPEQIAQAEANPPMDPAIQVAQIRAELEKMKIETTAQLKQQELQLKQALGAQDTDRDRAYVQAETERTQVERELRMQELQAKLQLAQLEYASKHQISLDELKTKLADTSMKLAVQKQLSDFDRDADMEKHRTPKAATPPTEPAGRAKPGEAFQA